MDRIHAAGKGTPGSVSHPALATSHQTQGPYSFEPGDIVGDRIAEDKQVASLQARAARGAAQLRPLKSGGWLLTAHGFSRVFGDLQTLDKFLSGAGC